MTSFRIIKRSTPVQEINMSSLLHSIAAFAHVVAIHTIFIWYQFTLSKVFSTDSWPDLNSQERVVGRVGSSLFRPESKVLMDA